MPTYELLPDGNRRVPLAGGHAEVKFGASLRRADEKAVLHAIDDSGLDLTKPGTAMVTVLQDAVLLRLIRRWTLTDSEGEPLAITVEALDNLSPADHRLLTGAAGEFTRELFLLLTKGPEGLDPKSEPSSSPQGAAGS